MTDTEQIDYFCLRCSSVCTPTEETDDKAGDWCSKCGTTTGKWQPVSQQSALSWRERNGG